MITQEEIRAKALEIDISPSNVQRDYVFGWLLYGIFAQSTLGQKLILKGGNALRKAYFATTRFSDDLDFTTEESIDADDLLAELNRVCQAIQVTSGIAFNLDRNRVADEHIIAGNKKVYKVRLYFQDFENHFAHMTLSIKMDITEHDRIFLPPQPRFLIHPYSDAEKCRTEVRCIKLEEAMADKLKCLIQRRHTFDLFDLVHAVFVNDELELDKGEIIRTFLKKTIFEPSPLAAKNLLLGLPLDLFNGYWDKYIVCPRPSRIPFSTAVSLFTEGLQELFMPFSFGRHSDLAYFPAQLRNPIMQAGADRTLLRLEYGGRTRLVEPYSLAFKWRADGHGQEYLYVYDRTGGTGSGPGIKSLLHTGITMLENTEEKYTPRYEIELAKAGEFGRSSYFARPFAVSRRMGNRRLLRATNISRRVFLVECMYCGKTFRRITASTRLNPHKDQYGNRCLGRIGFLK